MPDLFGILILIAIILFGFHYIHKRISEASDENHLPEPQDMSTDKTQIYQIAADIKISLNLPHVLKTYWTSLSF
ncbi:MAG: hypothetical protein GQ561_08460 [Calditrichae bacterium]|nr:hypothetical protein [Calditrichia bacterium]